APRGIVALRWPVVRRLGRYAGALLRSRAFRLDDADTVELMLNRLSPDRRAALLDRQRPTLESGRVARELAPAPPAGDAGGARRCSRPRRTARAPPPPRPGPRRPPGGRGPPPGRSRTSPPPVEPASLLASADDLWSLALRLGAPVLAVRRGGGHTEPIVGEGQAGPAEGRL